MMRLATFLCFGMTALAVLTRPAAAEDADESLRVYGVYIDRTPKQSWTGFGMYLGNGLFLTAAHVPGIALWWWPRVEIGGTIYPTSVVKDGHYYGVDLTLLWVDPRKLPVSLALRRLPLCRAPATPGTDVIVVTQERTVHSVVLSPAEVAPDAPPEFRTAIKFIPRSGASGSGVLDAKKKCLLGIITRVIDSPVAAESEGKVKMRPIAKYFIPAAQIARFLPAGTQF